MNIIGIDFSGSQHAGRSIWISEADATDGLRIVSVERADSLLGTGTRREHVLPALVEYISSKKNAFIGIDFPFTVAQSAMFASPWRKFATSLENNFATPDELRSWCWQAAGARELKRETEKVASTPFASYNLRIMYQTYFGITQVIAPLLRSGTASFPPMEQVETGKPSVIEICPSSTLKSFGQSTVGYKKSTAEGRQRREVLIAAAKEHSAVTNIKPVVEEAAIDDPKGDALDAILAAVAASRGAAQIMNGPIDLHGPIDEGHVFV